MYIGAHVSTAGGLLKTLERGQAIGAEALQIFPSAPQRWAIRGWSEEICEKFQKEWPKHFKQVVFHAPYLLNLAAEKPQNLYLTKQSLSDTLKLASKLGIVGTIFHPGAYVNSRLGNQKQIREAIRQILAETPPETMLVYENSAGSVIGGQLEDLAWLVDNSTDKSRVAICLDSCHAFAAGYNLLDETGYEKFASCVKKLFGLKKVYAWHLNDSKFSLGSRRDRHANVGEGELGEAALARIVNDSRWRNLVGYLEVPGVGEGPDKTNLDRLKKSRLS